MDILRCDLFDRIYGTAEPDANRLGELGVALVSRDRNYTSRF